jgi:DNA polymerase-1
MQGLSAPLVDPLHPKYLIQSKEDFEAVTAYLDQEDIIGLDTETNAKFSKYELGLVGISLGFDLFSVYIPLAHIEGEQLDMGYVLEKLRPFLEDPNSRYICHNTKFDEMVFRVYGINCQGSGDDTMTMAWLLKEEGRHGLKLLVNQVLGYKMQTYEDVVTGEKRKKGERPDYNFALVKMEDALSYAADDAYYTLRLYHRFRAELERQAIFRAYEEIERPLIRVVGMMEWKGLVVDTEAVAAARIKFPSVMSAIEEDILEQAGQPFNVDSPKQLGTMLFDVLKIAKNPPVTKTGQYKTDAKTLAKYEITSPIVERILYRKKVKKTYDVFIEGLQPHIQHGRVHGTFNPNGAATGRFSSSKPNLQQLQGDEIESIKVRDFFIPSPGNTYVIGDYGQVELRVMAHLAQDEVAIAAFYSGRDFHSETARAMFSLGEHTQPTTRQRFYAKGLNFGIPYGRGPSSVGESLGIPGCCCGTTTFNEEGRKIHAKGCWTMGCGNCGVCFTNKWYEGFPKVGPYKQEVLKECRNRGYVRTLAGRKRRLPAIKSSDQMIRSGAERQAFNTVCQGGAADILLQIHDELVVESPIEHAEEVCHIMNQVLEHPINGTNPLRLPLKFEPVIVDRWSKAK